MIEMIAQREDDRKMIAPCVDEHKMIAARTYYLRRTALLFPMLPSIVDPPGNFIRIDDVRKINLLMRSPYVDPVVADPDRYKVACAFVFRDRSQKCAWRYARDESA